MLTVVWPMADTDRVPSVLRFGVFELDLPAGELRKHNLPLKLHGQPIEILALLLERPGQVITRDELRQRLWSTDTFVDFEHGLNAAIQRLRAALNDSAERPRYIETLARRGYRYIGPMDGAGRNGAEVLPAIQYSAAEAVLPVRAQPQAAPASPMIARPRISVRFVVTAVILSAAVAFGVYRYFEPPPVPRVTHMTRLTNLQAVDPAPRPISDGVRYFFEAREGNHWQLYQMSLNAGVPEPLSIPLPNPRILRVSPDRSEFLLHSGTFAGEEGPLWVMPVQGGTPKRLGEAVAIDAIWTPDGKQILYTNRKGLFRMNADGTQQTKWLDVPGDADWLQWSPDERVLRFNVTTPSTWFRTIWEVNSDGSNLRPLIPREWHDPPYECCGVWTPDGNYFIFHSTRNGVGNLWVVPEKPGFLRRGAWRPVQLTVSSTWSSGPLLSADGRRLLMVSGEAGDELLRYDPRAAQLRPYLGGLHTDIVSFSPDGKYIAYSRRTPRSGIWRSRSDGTESFQVASAPAEGAHRPRWSPDGTQLVFSAMPNSQTEKLYLVSSSGGAPQPVVSTGGFQNDPDWSPDGQSLVFTRSEKDRPEIPNDLALAVWNFREKKLAKIPGSDGLNFPRWSPAGRYIAAFAEDGNQLRRILLFDLKTQQWTVLAKGNDFSWMAWSSDGDTLYYQDVREEGRPLFRRRVPAGKPELVTSFENQVEGALRSCLFVGLDPEDAPILLVRKYSGDMYALDLDLP